MVWSESARWVMECSPSPGLNAGFSACAGTGSTVTFKSGIRTRRRSVNSAKQSVRSQRVTPTSHRPTCGQENAFSLTVVPKRREASRYSLSRPLGRRMCSESGAMGSGENSRTRSV